MAPAKPTEPVSPFAKDEKVLCFHHEMLYEAKVLDARPSTSSDRWQYKIHYKGWKNTVSDVSLLLEPKREWLGSS